MKYVVFNVRTTGLEVKDCGIHRLSGKILDENLEVLEFFDYAVRPHRNKKCNREALALDGLTVTDLRNYTLDPNDALKEFSTLLSKYVNNYDPTDKLLLISYNLRFQEDFLRQWFIDGGDKFFGSRFWAQGVDLLSESARLLANVRSLLPNLKFDTVIEALGIPDRLSYIEKEHELLKIAWSNAGPLTASQIDKIHQKYDEEEAKRAEEDKPEVFDDSSEENITPVIPVTMAQILALA